MILPSTFRISLLTIMPGTNTDSEPLDFLMHCSHPPPCQPHTHPSLVVERNVGFGVVQNWVPNSLLPGLVALGSFAFLSQLRICETRKGCSGCVRSRADVPWGPAPNVGPVGPQCLPGAADSRRLQGRGMPSAPVVPLLVLTSTREGKITHPCLGQFLTSLQPLPPPSLLEPLAPPYSGVALPHRSGGGKSRSWCGQGHVPIPSLPLPGFW